MRHIANVAARRKHLAADLVEEHLYDLELRYEFNPNETSQENNTTLNGGRGMQRFPMLSSPTSVYKKKWVGQTFRTSIIQVVAVITLRITNDFAHAKSYFDSAKITICIITLYNYITIL
jgi:hypothetical protein